MSRTASQWNPSVQAPDLSNVLKEARQMGRNTAYADFYDDLKKRQEERAEANKAAEAEKEAAKQDLGNEPESEGFWSKLGQGALDGAMRVIDVLSRPNYAVANAVLHDNQQDESVWEDLTSIDLGGAKALWEGFSGKEKTTFGQVLAHRADDGEQDFMDNKWFQGIAGFGLDVMLDPTTYIGVGLVTKPLRGAGKEAANLAQIDRKAQDLSKNIADLPPVGDEAIGLSQEEIYTVLTGRVLGPKGKKSRQPIMSREAQKASRVRNYTDNVSALKDQIRKRGDLDETIKKQYDAQIDQLRLDYRKALDDYGKHAYRSAAKRFNEKDVKLTNVNLLDEADRILPMAKVADAFENYAKWAAKQPKEFRKNPDKFHELLGPGWIKDTRLSKQQKDEIFYLLDDVIRGDKTYNELGDAIVRGATPEIRAIENAIAVGNRTGDDVKALKSQLSSAYAGRNQKYRQQHMRRAEVFFNILRYFTGDETFMNKFKDLDSLLDRKATIQKRLDEDLAFDAPSQTVVKTSQDIDRAGLEAGESTVNDEVIALQQELREIDDLINEKMYRSHGEMGVPDEIDLAKFELNEKWLKENADSPFGKAVNDAVEGKTEQIKRRLLDTWKREQRAKRNAARNPSADTKLMFGEGKNSKVPAITINGQKVLKTEKEKLRSLVTDADRAKYREAAEKAEHRPMTTGDKDEFVDISNRQDVTVGDAVERHINDKVGRSGFAVQSMEHNAFDRVFEEQWGMSVKQAISNKAYDEGRAIRVGGWDEHGRFSKDEQFFITKNEMYDTLLEDPDQLAYGFGWKIPVEVKGQKVEIPWERAKKLGVTSKEWRKSFRNWVQANKGDNSFRTKVESHYDSALRKQQTAKRVEEPKATDVRIPNTVIKAKEAEARKEAIASVGTQIKQGRFEYFASKDFELFQGADDLAKQHEALVAAARHEYAEKARQLAMEKPRGNTKAVRIKQQAQALKAERDAKIEALEKAHKEAVKTREAMEERLDEQVLLDLLMEPVDNATKKVQFSFAGMKMLEFSSPRALTAATEKIGGLPILQKTAEKWNEAFRPASRFSPELNLARLRAQGNVNDVLKHHLDEIFHAFNKYSPAKRRAALNSVIKGVPTGVDKELYETTQKFFDDILKFTNHSHKVGDDPLIIPEFNKYLPDEFKLVPPDGVGSMRDVTINTVQDLFRYMGRLKPDTDPMKVLWTLRTAGEKSLAEKGMKFTIAESFGIKRILLDNETPGELTESLLEKRKLIEALKDKHGWTTVDGFNEKYLFAPQAAKEIETLMDMMRPERTQEIVRLYDKMLRIWKSTVTIYNPGYYTRNGIGEVIMGLFDGVSNPRWYSKASAVIKHAMPDEVDEALKTITPWKNYKSQGGRKILKTKFGKELTIEDVWVLYHENNLKSGFISTEFDHYFPAANTARSTSVGQFATKINDKMRDAGEKYEDFFRLAHFMNRIARSNHRNIQDAAKEAAQYTRKYHFDYTDFTPFEKTKMMRVIPFYKWTRKAMPLMVGMLFTNPAKVNLYPKAMQNLSYATGGTDPLTDQTGFVPDYEEVTPQWMKNLMSYPMGEPDAAGAQNYMRVATPQFDIYSMLQNPFSATWGMLTPFAKVPIEQGAGQTIDPEFNMKLEDGGDRLEHLARTSPAGSFINNILKNKGDGDSALLEPDVEGRHFPSYDERLTSFLTGLGFYENNKARQEGEEFRRNMENR